MSEKVRTVYARLNAVKAGVQRVAKTGKNQHFGYDFATESDIVDCIRPLCAEHGVALVYHGPVVDTIKITDIPTSKGGTKFLYQMWVEYEVVNVDDPSDRFPVRGYGEAMDQDDKGHNKALTNAHKYVLIRLFDISTGDTADDPDHHGSDDRKPGKAVTPKNAAKTQAAIDAGAQHRDDEETQQFTAALAEIRWTLTDFKAELVDYAKMKVPRSLDKRFSEWPAFAKDKARELFKKIKADAQPANNQTFTAEDDIPG